MAGMHHPWAFVFGILGNVISFMVYLAPAPTFYRIYTKGTTEGFQADPYVVALFSAMMMIYYALIKTANSFLLITINGIGCFIETAYIVMFLLFAHRSARVYTLKLLTLLNGAMYTVILSLTLLLLSGPKRVQVIGFINVGLSLSVFAAPLSIMRLVIQTRSVEYMPFSLSFFLTVSAVVWCGYGMLIHDFFVAFPNVLGFLLGVMQMVLYVFYKNAKPPAGCGKDPEKAAGLQEHRQPDLVIKQSTTAGSEVHPIELEAPQAADEGGDQAPQRQHPGVDNQRRVDATAAGGAAGIEMNLPQR